MEFISDQYISKLSKEFTDTLILDCESHRFYYSIGADNIFLFIKLYINI